ncbi:MAG TPA: BTAD domain-containing putative transcriptional regulator [Gaiellaceae bacterium]|nr:BTAD domain-containing putative transcriptional regulator [Gaiellaceae bacterium]
MGGARRAGDPAMELRLLGPLGAMKGGSTVSLGGPKPRALLALLALDAGRVVSVDRLVEELWTGAPPETANHAVQVYVSQLRKTLGDVIVRRAPGYVLDLDPEAVDVHRFTRLATDGHEELRAGNGGAAAGTLRDALALWRGPALADFAYEPFAQTEIARLEDLRFTALEDRIDADLSVGRHAELIAEIEALVEAQPLRERPRALLMRALYLAGRQADALAAYRAARGTLVEELGIEPGPELKELEAAMLRQDDALLPTAPAPAIRTRRLAAVLSVGLEAVGAIDLEVEDRELETAASAVVAAVTRHGGAAERLADGSVTAVFGVPVAYEDDPIRAARAALEARDALLPLEAIRFVAGIEIGEVVAADRTASGPPVRAAALLRQTADAGEILVGEATARRLRHASRLEPRGDASALIEVAEQAPAFERRLDAPLVGRKRELAALRKALKRAVDGSSAQVALVIGPPGVGKSRLAAELARRAKGLTALFGRCLSYGDGITYWPLREVLEQAAQSAERDAILSALEADTPPPAPEIAWAFRQMCEALAREKPLVVLFDDVHWAEPTFLELVEHLADKGEGPILAVCLAREELLEDRPAFLEGRKNVERIALDALSTDETDTLLESLGGAVLEGDQRARIVEAAEGNPFFLEQLLALALEGGLAERALPETVQALLAARLDRLGPGERAVLERGAVVGKEFTAEDVTSLLDPEAAPTVGSHLRTLSGRGFVRPRPEGAFSFRHVLVQEAVYRAAPKRLRAELHERFADRLDNVAEVVAELDEFVGYHLEQAYRLRTELGEADRRTARLAEDGGRRLGEAGVRALKRGDTPATINLLGRATSLIPQDASLRRLLLCELGIALRMSGASSAAADVLAAATESSQQAGDRQVELRARIEYEYVRLHIESGRTADALLDAAAAGIPMFETVGDDRSLGRAWLLSGYVRGGRRGDHKAWLIAAERALVHYVSSGWPASTCLGEISHALYHGPTPVHQAITRCKELLRDQVSDRAGGANVHAFLGGLVAQHGDFDEARELIASSRTTFEDLGQRTAAANIPGPILGDVELLAGDASAAERILSEVCAELQLTRDWSHLASRASDLAEALYVQGCLDAAEQWTRVAEEHAPTDDIDAQTFWRSVRAKIHARRGEITLAEDLARAAAQILGESDGLNRHARAQRDLGEVLLLGGKTEEASAAFGRAAELYEQKGNLVGVAHVQSLQDDRALV